MTFTELEALRTSMNSGVNAFCSQVRLPKSTYYTKKRQDRLERQAKVQMLIEAEVKRQCELHPTLGYRPIHQLVKDALKLIISQMSVYRVMKRLGLLQAPVKAKRKPKPMPEPDLDPSQVGLMIGLDFTHWRPKPVRCWFRAKRAKKPICNVLEYESRFCLASVASQEETAATAILAVKQALAESARLGLPVKGIVVKSDHGTTFTADEFRNFLKASECSPSYSAVGVPQREQPVRCCLVSKTGNGSCGTPESKREGAGVAAI